MSLSLSLPPLCLFLSLCLSLFSSAWPSLVCMSVCLSQSLSLSLSLSLRACVVVYHSLSLSLCLPRRYLCVSLPLFSTPLTLSMAKLPMKQRLPKVNDIANLDGLNAKAGSPITNARMKNSTDSRKANTKNWTMTAGEDGGRAYSCFACLNCWVIGRATLERTAVCSY